jgi:hypothetical protein
MFPVYVQVVETILECEELGAWYVSYVIVHTFN